MKYTYSPKGVCSRQIDLELDGNTIKSVEFTGGCNGNTKGISKLVEGQDIDVIINKLQGTTCGMRNTSCPDQLAEALKSAKNNL